MTRRSAETTLRQVKILCTSAVATLTWAGTHGQRALRPPAWPRQPTTRALSRPHGRVNTEAARSNSQRPATTRELRDATARQPRDNKRTGESRELCVSDIVAVAKSLIRCRASDDARRMRALMPGNRPPLMPFRSHVDQELARCDIRHTAQNVSGDSMQRERGDGSRRGPPSPRRGFGGQ